MKIEIEKNPINNIHDKYELKINGEKVIEGHKVKIMAKVTKLMEAWIE